MEPKETNSEMVSFPDNVLMSCEHLVQSYSSLILASGFVQACRPDSCVECSDSFVSRLLF